MHSFLESHEGNRLAGVSVYHPDATCAFFQLGNGYAAEHCGLSDLRQSDECQPPGKAQASRESGLSRYFFVAARKEDVSEVIDRAKVLGRRWANPRGRSWYALGCVHRSLAGAAKRDHDVR